MSEIFDRLQAVIPAGHPWLEARPNAGEHIPRVLRLVVTGRDGEFVSPSTLSPEERDVLATAVWNYHTLGVAGVEASSERLEAALSFVDQLVLAPGTFEQQDVVELGETFGPTDVVAISQLVSFLAFYLRLGVALAVADGRPNPVAAAPGVAVVGPVSTNPVFEARRLGWRPWVEPPSRSELSPEQVDALVEPSRVNQPYFRLLAREPQVLKSRTLIDFDIFTNEDGGAARQDREFAAAAVSTVNGCRYCCSVHALRAIEFSGDLAQVEAFLGGAQPSSPEWVAVAEASRALTATPSQLGPAHVEALAAAGLDDRAVVDVLASAAFFNWANRLMLVLGRDSEGRDTD